MKKLPILVLFLLVLSAFALALEANTDMAVGIGKNKSNAVEITSDVQVGKNKTMDAEAGITASSQAKTNRTENKTGPVATVDGSLIHVGLTNALANVENANARAAIEANMQRFLERYEARINNMTDVNVTVNEEGNVEVTGKEPVRFLGFIKGKATTRFEVENNGQVSVKQPWYRFLYASDASVETNDASAKANAKAAAE
jgi:hypothetical protein